MVGCSWEGKDSTTGEWGLILYRKDRFELIDNGDFWLTSTPDVVSKIRGSECVRICTWAMLRDKVTDKTFVIANTHLDHKINTVRTKQAGYLLDGIKDFIEKYPVFLTGDFNAIPGSQAYLKLTETFYDARTTALEGTEDTSCTYDNYGLEGTGYIYDYCMCDDGAKALFYKVVNESFDGYVSDHYGVLAQFIIN
jgi:endonuclease/exonuclease/phosphatase family metal-dependent hydrolase